MILIHLWALFQAVSTADKYRGAKVHAHFLRIFCTNFLTWCKKQNIPRVVHHTQREHTGVSSGANASQNLQINFWIWYFFQFHV